LRRKGNSWPSGILEKGQTWELLGRISRRRRHPDSSQEFREKENIHFSGRSFQRKQHPDGFEEFPEEADIAVARRCSEKKKT
jgi:hypothetical protein